MDTANQLIDEIQLKLSKVHQPLPEPLNQHLLKLIQFFFSSSQLHSIRTPLLGLINSLDQHNLRLPVPLCVHLIENYAQLNRSIVQDIIQHNLDRDPKYILLFELYILQLLQELSLQPEHPQPVQTLCLITQSHPQLLQLFYQPSSTSHYHDTPFVSILKIIQNDSQTSDVNARAHLIFIIVKVLKDGIISRLQQASVAFDSTALLDQLSIILSSKSTSFLNDLCLNYANFIDQLDQFIGYSSNTGSYLQNLSIKSRNRLKTFFINSKDFLIFTIFKQIKSDLEHDQSSTESKIIDVMKNRKNLFDDHQMDVSLLRTGKSKLDEREILNDKSHLTDSIKMRIKSRLEEIEMNPDEEESEIPIIYDDNDDDERSDVLGENDTDERLRRLKKSVQVDIFSDDDHLFFSNKKEPIDKSDEEDSSSEPGESKKMEARQINRSFNSNIKNHHADKSQEKGKQDGNQPRNAGGRVGGTGLKNLRGQPRTGGERGRSSRDIGSRGGGARGRGGSQSQGKSAIKEKPDDRKPESSSTQSHRPKPHFGDNMIRADGESVEGSNSNPKPADHSTRGAGPSRGTGARGRGSSANHQKKLHDRRVRGRDRKLAQISGGI